MSSLYVVSTPIGNLEDFSFRALRVLKEVDLILCEDTRVTKKLLARYDISRPLISYHQHSKLTKLEYIKKELQKGRNLALVSDAGTPAINDPGAKLISYLISELPDIDIIPIPGPSAIITALSVCGFNVDRFVFLGFAPTKNKRSKFFKDIVKCKYPVVFYESPHRILKSLNQLEQACDKEIVVGRELTKKFEIIYRGQISRIIEQLGNEKIKGEFVVVVECR